MHACMHALLREGEEVNNVTTEDLFSFKETEEMWSIKRRRKKKKKVCVYMSLDIHIYGLHHN